MAGRLDLERLEKLIRSGDVDTVVVCFPDMQGRLMGKRVTGAFFLDSVVQGMHACDYLLALDMEMEPVPGFQASSWDLGYGDFGVRPDPATLRLIPWLEGTALILGDVVDHEGGLVPHAPRSVLKRQIERLRAAGHVAKMGSELELYVFNDSFESAHEKRYDGLEPAGWYIEDYHVLQTTKEEGLVRAIRNGMEGAGVPVEFSKGEWGPGQEEINLRYAEALEMADRHVIYKNGAKEIAWQQGKAITFMAKWREDLAGSSCHVHSSLWSPDGRALFGDDTDPMGMSTVFRQWLAGQLACARAMTLFFAPYVNSYKRFLAGSFAPTRIAWSLDNRTAGFRIVGHGASIRGECRVPGADVNPYLAYAATIAAGLHGIEAKLELPAAIDGNVYEMDGVTEVPGTLREAIAALDENEVLRAALTDEVVDHYLHAARWEQSAYNKAVTDWERRRYFERS